MVLDVLSKDATCSTQVVKAAADKDKKKKRKKGINGDALPKISRSFSPAVAIDVTNKHKKHMKYKKGELDGGDNDGVRLIKEKKHSIINTRDDCRDGTEFSRVTHDLNKCKKMEKEKKKKKKKGEEEIIADDDCNPDVIHLPNEMNNKKRKKKCDAVDKGNCLSSLDEKKSKKKKRKGQINVQVDGTLSLDDFEISNNEKKRKKTKSTKRKLANNETIDYETTDKIENSIPEKKRKRVRFSSDVEMFPSENIPKKLRKEIQYTGTQIRGKRFTPEEDNLLKEAVYKYIEVCCHSFKFQCCIWFIAKTLNFYIIF